MSELKGKNVFINDFLLFFFHSYARPFMPFIIIIIIYLICFCTVACRAAGNGGSGKFIFFFSSSLNSLNSTVAECVRV